jgi:hypothetical protein
VVGLDHAELAKYRQHRFGIGIAKAEQVEIARGAVRIIKPGSHQHSAFEDEAVAVLALAEAVKEPFNHVAHQQ